MKKIIGALFVVGTLVLGVKCYSFAEESVGEPVVYEESLSEGLAFVSEGPVPEGIETEDEAELVGGVTIQGLNVEAHTQAEIQKFFNAHPWSTSDKVTYRSEPSYSEPYYQGQLSDYTVERALNAVNTIRYIAGLSSDIVLNREQENLAQSGSFVNCLNGVMTHYPERPTVLSASKYDTLFKDGYTGCSFSNLAWGYGTLNSAIINGWMSDADASNIDRVGHRRWILNPSATSTGFGANGSYYSYYSFSRDGESTATNVAWPAANMPVEYFGTYEPWSLSTGKSLDMDSVSVTLKRKSDSKVWKFNSSSADGYFNVNNVGYGITGCVIFRPDNLSSLSAGDVFEVTVVLDSSTTVKYTVNFFSLDLSAASKEYTPKINRWVKDKKTGKYWYRYKNGAYPKNKWAKIDGKWYLFDKNGWMLTGWQKRNGNWYYLGTDGVMQAGGWIYPNDSESYYMKATGEMAVGWTKVYGVWSYFKQNGEMVKEKWVKTAGKWYYLDRYGYMTIGFANIDGKEYYFKDSGEMVTGWKKIGGDWYYFKSSGEKAINCWLKSGGNYYYMNDRGAMVVNEEILYKDNYYYLDENGVMLTGWRTGFSFHSVVEEHYYYDASGKRVSGWTEIDGNWYYFAIDGGSMYNRRSLLGPDGTTIYSLDENGVGKPSQCWGEEDSKIYHLDYFGNKSVGVFSVIEYYANEYSEHGIIVTTYFYADEDGYLVTEEGWQTFTVNGETKKTYVKEDGTIPWGQYMIDGEYYWFDLGVLVS